MCAREYALLTLTLTLTFVLIRPTDRQTACAVSLVRVHGFDLHIFLPEIHPHPPSTAGHSLSAAVVRPWRCLGPCSMRAHRGARVSADPYTATGASAMTDVPAAPFFELRSRVRVIGAAGGAGAQLASVVGYPAVDPDAWVFVDFDHGPSMVHAALAT